MLIPLCKLETLNVTSLKRQNAFKNIPLSGSMSAELYHRYLMTRLSLQVFYLWRHVSSTALPFILWWPNLEILFAPLHRSSSFIGELRCQAIQMENGPYIAERTQTAVYVVRCLWTVRIRPLSAASAGLPFFLDVALNFTEARGYIFCVSATTASKCMEAGWLLSQTSLRGTKGHPTTYFVRSVYKGYLRQLQKCYRNLRLRLQFLISPKINIIFRMNKEYYTVYITK
jgi:hypothetical protein